MVAMFYLIGGDMSKVLPSNLSCSLTSTGSFQSEPFDCQLKAGLLIDEDGRVAAGILKKSSNHQPKSVTRCTFP